MKYLTASKYSVFCVVFLLKVVWWVANAIKGMTVDFAHTLTNFTEKHLTER